jgi:hypothetical protein
MLHWSDSERRGFVSKLDAIERVLVTAGRMFLGLLIAAIIAGAAFIIVKRPWGAGNQGEWFYFGVAVLLVLGWCIGQYTSLGARRCRDHRGSPVTLRSEAVDGGQQWTFQFGSPAAVSDPFNERDSRQVRFSHSFQVPLATLAKEVLPDERALSLLRDELARGASLDEACRSVQPDYEAWSGLQRRAYQLCVNTMLAQGAASHI